jgi:hypothetical protein
MLGFESPGTHKLCCLAPGIPPQLVLLLLSHCSPLLTVAHSLTACCVSLLLPHCVTCCSSQLPISEEPREGDVYRVEQEDLSGPWEVTNVLQPTIYENDKGEEE